MVGSRQHQLFFLVVANSALYGAGFLSPARFHLTPGHRPQGPVQPKSFASASSNDAVVSVTSIEDTAPSSRRYFLEKVAVGAVAVLVATSVNADPAIAANVDTRNAEASASLLLADASSATTSIASPTGKVDFEAILQKAGKKALGGGKAGASAAVVQVLSLMWLRTAMNYQYRYGGDLVSSLKTLYADGGVSRLYQGLPFALVQGPLTRFGDTAANVGVLALLETIPETASLPLPLRTAAGSVAAGLWRIILMPIDTSKTAMQVEGAAGLESLVGRVTKEGPSPLYQGALASAAATAAGHYPWFLTYNFLNDYLPGVSKEELLLFLLRSAFLGLSASCVSDCVSNSLRVIKTTKQTAGLGKESDGQPEDISYRDALNIVLEQDGIQGLFGRGLKTRLLTNAIQGAVFSILWKYFQTIQT